MERRCPDNEKTPVSKMDLIRASKREQTGKEGVTGGNR